MDKTITGGAAFPTIEHDDSRISTAPGMTLRDYFAARALAALVGHPDTFSAALGSATKKGQEGAAYIAETAYELADAMLVAAGAA